MSDYLYNAIYSNSTITTNDLTYTSPNYWVSYPNGNTHWFGSGYGASLAALPAENAPIKPKTDLDWLRERVDEICWSPS